MNTLLVLLVMFKERCTWGEAVRKIEQEEKELDKKTCHKCGSSDVRIEKRMRRVNGPHVPGKLMSYGEYYTLYTCLKCYHFWETK
jgi:hypothetical protein